MGIAFLVICLLASNRILCQIYAHNFGTTAISAHPYTVAPTVFDSHLSNSAWSNSGNTWTSTAGSTGEAIRITSTTNATIALTFNVAANFEANITAFDFWRQRSNLGPQNWSMTINGINVGSGTTGTTGAAIGNTAVANAVSGLSGTVTVVISLSGGTGNGTFRLDDFTLFGTVTSSCSGATITSFTPLTGPQNTLVTINGSGFLLGSGTSSLKFNGIEATGFNVISDNQIKAFVPAGNATGAISVTTNSCESFAAVNFTELVSVATANYSSDIYISEIFDAQAGDGGVIEIYNGTANPVNLAGYTIRRYGDVGGPTFYTINLTGIIPPGGIFLIGIGTGTTPCSITENQHYGTGFNSNDEFELYNGATLIDNVHAPVNVGYSVIRNMNAVAPKPVFNAADWNTSTTEDCSNIGIHNVPVGTPPAIASPASIRICDTNSTVFSVAIANPSGFVFQWKTLNTSGIWVNVTNAAPYSGANSNTLAINPTPAIFDGNQYYCQAVSATSTVVSHAAQLEVNPTIIPDFATTLAVCNGAIAPALNATSPNGITGTWSPAVIDNTASGNYIFTPNPGQCAANVTLAVTVTGTITPDFPLLLTLCHGETAPVLNPISPNGITGIWTPATIDNTASANYTFTPNAGQCADVVIVSVTVNNLTVPDFATALTLCHGQAAPALALTSPNGISGTWNPTLINSSVGGNYVFTPGSGQCAQNATLAVTITNLTVPDFATTLTICSGGMVPTLNTISPNGISGTWSPTAINNTTNGAYIFTPNAGQCASNVSLNVTVGPMITPDFVTTLILCNGETAPALGLVSPNGISGTWSPAAINNTVSGNYIFTPNAGQCASAITLAVTVNPSIAPDFATNLTFCSGDAVPVLNAVSPNGISGMWNPTVINNTANGTYVFTPNAGQCAATQTLNVAITNTVVPDFATVLTICNGDTVPALNTISPNGISGTWNPATINNSANGTYIFTPNAGQCASAITLSVTVNNAVIPDFATNLTFCSGDAVPVLNAVSPNGISGTWNPMAINNTTSGNYIFTPNVGQCASVITLAVTVNPSSTPDFVTSLTFCSGDALPVLNTVSPNGISGAWNPMAINNTASGNYIFTPNVGQCASVITLAVTVNPTITPDFATSLTFCSGDAVPVLNTVSPNGISGAWNPMAINNTASGNYIFTPNVGQCASVVTLAVTVNNAIIPDFATTLTICNGGVVPTLNTISPNGISGTWSPTTINNTVSGNYIFTPNVGHCANAITLAVTVNNAIIPDFATTLTICSGDVAPALNTVSPNGISGIWNPTAINNTGSGSYIFTPKPGQCATNVTLAVTVNALPEPILQNAFICVDQNGQVFNPAVLDCGVPNSNHTFSWTVDGRVLPAATNTHLATEPGLYVVTVTNTITGCSADAQATVIATPSATAHALVSADFEQNPTITVVASGGSGNYEFTLDDGAPQQNNQFLNVGAGEHTVVFRDKDGCAELTLVVAVLDYPRFFTPNGDGYNDFWNIGGLSGQPQSKIYLFDRYGKLIKSLKPSDATGWDGTYNGNPLPATDYWFELFYEDRLGASKTFRSHFSLKR